MFRSSSILSSNPFELVSIIFLTSGRSLQGLGKALILVLVRFVRGVSCPITFVATFIRALPGPFQSLKRTVAGPGFGLTICTFTTGC